MTRHAVKSKNGKPPCLFLSHSGADTEAARELKRRILASPAAKQAGLTVWFDKDNLVPGQEWQKQLEAALTTITTAFAVYVGSKGVINWVEREVRLGLSHATGKSNFPFIPILAPESDGSSALPPFAAQYQSVRNPLGDVKALADLIAAALGGNTAKPVLTDRPFIGLKAMTEEWSDRFFGREKETDELINLMRRYKFVAIVSESGAGKSSLAQAGLVPKFRGGALEDVGGNEPDERQRHVVVMRPGSAPVDGLRNGIDTAARMLKLDDEKRYRLRQRVKLTDPFETAHAIRCDFPHDKTQTLLIVDQFEELLTQTPEDRRKEFVTLLMALLQQDIHILITVRSDYFNLAAAHAALWTELTKDSHGPVYRLRRISDAGIGDAVSRPLIMAGLDDEDERKALVSLFKRDVMDRPGDLALVQMALEAVWRRRNEAGGLVNAYSFVGSIAGALSHEADRVSREKLDDGARALLVPLFVRLIRLGETGGVTRRAARFGDLGQARSALAQKLTTEDCARLLVIVGDDSVEISHEALVTQWPWLQNQIGSTEAASSIRRLGNLMEAAATWQTAPQKEKGRSLANSSDHTRYSSLAMRHGDWLSAVEMQFVQASAKAISSVDAGRKLLLYGSMVVTIIFAILLGVVVYYYQRTNDAVQLAEINQTAALAALSRVTLADRPNDAMKLALASWPRNTKDSAPKLRVSLDAIEQALVTPHTLKILRGHESSVDQIAWSPDGKLLATASADKTGRVWDATTGKEIAVLKGHESNVNQIAWSPDGKLLATASWDKTGRVWDAATGKEIAVLTGHGSNVYHVAWSPDGKLLATSGDKTGWVWDAATGKEIAVLTGHEDSVNEVAWSPDGKLLATASDDNTGRVWDAATGKEIAVLTEHEDSVNHIAWSPDGKLLATSDDNTGRVWDAATGKEIAVLTGHEDSVYHIAWSPDGKLLATASADKTGRVWDAATGKETAVLTGHEDRAYQITWSPDGKLLATASDDNTGRVWDTATGKEIAVLTGHEDSVNHIAWSPDGKLLATASDDKTGRVWDAATGKEIAVLTGHGSSVNHIAWSPDGKLLATSGDKTGRVWDAATGKEIAVLTGHENRAYQISWSPDGKLLATASWDNTGRVWDAATGKEIAVLTGHGSNVYHVVWSPDGKLLATASEDKTGRVWDAATGKETAVLTGHGSNVYHVAWSPDGKLLATVSADKTGRVWDAATGKEIAVLAGHEDSVNHIAWSPDGKLLATASADKTGRVWDAATGKEIAVLTGHEDSVYHIAWSPDGKLLATASDDNTGRVWDAATGKEIAVLTGHGSNVNHIAWSPDGKLLATSGDKTGRVWDAATGKEIAVLTGHEDSVNHIAWSPDGKLLATSGDKTGRVWDLHSIPPGNLFEIACANLPDMNLDRIAEDYAIKIDRPICVNPKTIPLPPWTMDWIDSSNGVSPEISPP